MKIVHAHWCLGTGGTENMMVDIMNAQAEQHEIWCLIVNDVVDENVKRMLNSTIKFKCYHRKSKIKGILPIVKFNRDLQMIRPDVIHTHGEVFPRIIIYNKAPIVLTRHSTLGDGKYLDKPKQLCFISEAVRMHSVKQGYDGIVVYNGINIEKIHKKTDSVVKHIYNIVQVGRLETIKGQHLLIKAAKKLVNCGITNFSIDIIGQGSQYESLLKMIKENHLEENVHLLGLKDREYVYSHLCNYDLLVQPSLSEGFGLSIAEGMAAGISVLTSDLDGPMQVINYGVCGEYFKSGDIDDLVKKLEMFIMGKIQDKSKEATMFLKENFSIQSTAKKYLSIYNSLK